MRRRECNVVGGAVAVWPFAARLAKAHHSLRLGAQPSCVDLRW
jgi:hypothetical protein